MNPQPEQDLEHRFHKLEAEINQTSPSYPVSQPKQPLQQTNAFQPVQLPNRLLNWFNGLPGLGKLIIIGIAALIGFGILQAVLRLVAAVISLAILAVLLYLIYQFFLARSSETKD